MHLLVLSAFRPFDSRNAAALIGSQCTFWCSVLSDKMSDAANERPAKRVSMHLLVLSAFRP